MVLTVCKRTVGTPVPTFSCFLGLWGYGFVKPIVSGRRGAVPYKLGVPSVDRGEVWFNPSLADSRPRLSVSNRHGLTPFLSTEETPKMASLPEGGGPRKRWKESASRSARINPNSVNRGNITIAFSCGRRGTA